MEIYEAIRQMRIISEDDGTFSFSYISYSMTQNKCNGVVEVEHARLRKSNPKPKNELEDLLLEYTDLDTYEKKHCYKLLLLTFNNIDLYLK